MEYKIEKEETGGRLLFRAGERKAPFQLIQPMGQEEAEPLQEEVSGIAKAGIPFSFTGFVVEDWNQELSPWEAPPVFGKEGFGAGAEKTLEWVRTLVVPGAVCILGGYSLAGLFALWAGTRTDLFAGIAAASPSVWFPGWPMYAREQAPKARAIYLSLGDKEEKTRNKVMGEVGKNIRLQAELLSIVPGLFTTLEWNQGGHFQDPAGRTGRAFAWTLQQLAKGSSHFS